MTPEPLFHIDRGQGQVAGPYDVVQMAGLLRRRIITGETMTRREGTDDWKPFSWQPQFAIAREMPADATSTRVTELDEAAAAEKSGPIPLPSRETVLKLGALAGGALLAGIVAFIMAWLDATTGTCLLFLGGATALVAHCMIMARLLDEDYLTLGMVLLLPGGDLYYFLSNIWEYYTWFCVKYVGLAVVFGAMAGLAAAHAK